MTANERPASAASPVVNPYIAGNPVTGDAMFFGRDDVFDFIRANLIGQHQDNVLVLHGQRRTGKTSVLYQMHRHIDPSYVPILVDIQGMTLEGMSGFLWELAYTIQRGLRRLHGIRLDRPNRKNYQKDPRHEFQDVFLPQVQEATGERRLLLMFDEAAFLHDKVRSGDLEADVFRYLSSLMQHYAFLAFLFAIGAKLEQMQEEFSTLFRVAVYKEISFLDYDSAVELITAPVSEQYTYEPEVVDRIVRITSGHPYYTQLLCHTLFNRWQQVRFESATNEDMDAIIPQVIEAGTSNLKYAWDRGDGAEKAIAVVLKELIVKEGRSVTREELDEELIAHEISIPPGEVMHGLQNLALRDVINDQPPFAFRVDLMRRWLQQHAPIDWVKEEIQEDIRAWEHELRAPARRKLQLAGVLVTLLVLIGVAVGGYLYVNRPISPIEAATRTVEAQQLRERKTTAQALAALKQDPALQATATAQQKRQEAIAATQTVEYVVGLTATANIKTATAQAIETTMAAVEATKAAVETATVAAIQTATAQPTSTPTPTDTPMPTDTPTPTDTPLPTNTPTIAPTVPPTETPTPTLIPATGGRIVFVLRNEIHTCKPDGSDQKRLTFNGAAERDPAWSPNGQRLAYSSNLTGNNEIWVMNADGSSAYQLTNHPANDLYPAWSPNGSRIAFVSERDNTREVYVVPAGGGAPRRLTDNNIDESYPTWSPNGARIAFSGIQLGQGGMWTINADGSDGANPTKISGIAGTFADLTWVGGRVYFAAAHTQYGSDYNIFSVLSDGSGWSAHATGPGDDRSPSFSPSGAQWTFTNSNRLIVIAATGSIELFDDAIEPDWSPR